MKSTNLSIGIIFLLVSLAGFGAAGYLLYSEGPEVADVVKARFEQPDYYAECVRKAGKMGFSIGEPPAPGSASPSDRGAPPHHPAKPASDHQKKQNASARGHGRKKHQKNRGRQSAHHKTKHKPVPSHVQKVFINLYKEDLRQPQIDFGNASSLIMGCGGYHLRYFCAGTGCRGKGIVIGLEKDNM